MQVRDIPINDNMHEETQHGTSEFPVAVYTTQLNLNVLGYVNWHWHEELQFVYVIRGEVLFSVGATTFTLQEGEGLFINSEVLHMAKPAQSLPDSMYVCFDIHPSFVRGYPGLFIDRKYVIPYIKNKKFPCHLLRPQLEKEKKILDFLEEGYALFTSGEEGTDYQFYILCQNLWYHIIAFSKDVASSSIIPEQDERRLKAMMAVVQERYPEKLALADFSEAVSLCGSECCRFFKQYMGCTIFEYITKYRIERSIDALVSTAASISDIAFSCGFSTTSYYISRFKKETGCTPREYRKKHQ